MRLQWILLAASLSASCLRAADVVFHDTFAGKLGEGWMWRREDPSGWRVKDGALEVRNEPGNMWGPANNAKNVLIRKLPAAIAEREVQISITASNRPTEQYEQVDLVWYYDDSHQVKIGQELVDGKLSIVMGREEKDRTRTIAIIPLNAFLVQLRLTVKGNELRGEFRPDATGEWRQAGRCDLPVHGEPNVAIECYQGPEKVEHWARLTDFSVRVR